MKLKNVKINVWMLLLTVAPLLSQAQSSPIKQNWFNLDLKTDSTFGISTEKAYQELLKGKKSVPVTVAVIDGGVDVNHEDLKRVIRVNKLDKAGNKLDDDKNGYKDDIYGWSFLGSDSGNVQYDNLEITRLVREMTPRFKDVDTTKLSATDRISYTNYLKMKAELDSKVLEANQSLKGVNGFLNYLNQVIKKIGKDSPTLEDFKAFTPEGGGEQQIKSVMVGVLSENPNFDDFKKNQLDAAVKHYESQIKYQYNLGFDPRKIVGDNYQNSKERFYGNGDVTGPDALHGTHVAGIIAADRTNSIGIKGVANNVNILVVRTVPDGDERDKDVANSIRYAADNGAKVINMSFGKAYSKDKKVVDEAVKYAIAKDVLLVHAAGNDNKNLDKETNYPNRNFEGGGKATAWIEVGASGPIDDAGLKASFSNYGKTTVDVFAPGENINSTAPGNTYIDENGTSMASPVVAGLAALIRSYYPQLKATQVKDIILRSVTKVKHPVTLKTKEGETEVPFTDLCISGGIVNAYEALKLAASVATKTK